MVRKREPVREGGQKTRLGAVRVDNACDSGEGLPRSKEIERLGTGQVVKIVEIESWLCLHRLSSVTADWKAEPSVFFGGFISFTSNTSGLSPWLAS